MNGAHYLLKTAVAAGVNVCFSNPGTTEMAVVNAMDETPGMRGVLCLFEGVCTGAADGYARMAGRPALTLTHLGPGFANGVANLHNAKRARTPVVNIIGDHASWHLDADAPLNMDVESLAATVSGWQRRDGGPDNAGPTWPMPSPRPCRARWRRLIFPHDYQGAATENVARQVSLLPATPVDVESIDAAARLLSSGKRVALIWAVARCWRTGLRTVERITRHCGCGLFWRKGSRAGSIGAWGCRSCRVCPICRQTGWLRWAGSTPLCSVDARRPVAFFGWPDAPSYYRDR